MVKQPVVSIIAHTPEPERVVAAAARNCYSDTGPTALLEGLDRETAESFLQKIASLGHESVLEHASFTFSLENVSRALLAEITRHRIASFSVKSQRYVRETGFSHILPPTVQENDEALAVFDRAMEAAGEAYRALLELGIPPEDARFVLPNACCTHIVVTMNARELLHFFRLRCCNRAQWEIRSVASEMLRLARNAAPALFCKAGPSCVWGACGEGRMSCGRQDAVRERYRV
ncbi:MAG: FAD-dependent thymidylate synthase [Oscillospiraceae bacterium]|jgi:thymidylate synthase (FAD)|nr:FAD-dependent thymidylate synthase [Oscillospiraceae bacterium]